MAQDQNINQQENKLKEIKQIASDEVSKRPEDSNAYTKGQEGAGGEVPTQQSQKQQAPQEQQSSQKQQQTQTQKQSQKQQSPADDDPLKRLIGMVKGDDGAVDEIKVKKTFVVSRNKIANVMLRKLVEGFRSEGSTDADIIEYVLRLDKMIEDGDLDENYFIQKAEEYNG